VSRLGGEALRVDKPQNRVLPIMWRELDEYVCALGTEYTARVVLSIQYVGAPTLRSVNPIRVHFNTSFHGSKLH